MELVDLKGEQVFGRIQLQSQSKVQEMAWTIAQCYDIELNSSVYDSAGDLHQPTQVSQLQVLHICDQRDRKLNDSLKRPAREGGWHQAHLLLQMALERDIRRGMRRNEGRHGTTLGSNLLDDTVSGFSSEASFAHSLSHRKTGPAKVYDHGNKLQNVRVNKDKLEEILSTQKSMQNYEDALWSFEKSLNHEIRDNRL